MNDDIKQIADEAIAAWKAYDEADLDYEEHQQKVEKARERRSETKKAMVEARAKLSQKLKGGAVLVGDRVVTVQNEEIFVIKVVNV